MMRVLLTGVTGQVGGALCAPLSKIGTVMAADRSILDLSSPDSIEPKLGAMAPDLIINAAAYTAVDDAEDERGLAYCINATAPGILARWASGHNVPIVHFSTDYVFDGSGHQPWREDDPTAPLSFYGSSKLVGEKSVRDAGGNHLIIRTSWVFASKGKNFLRTIARIARQQTQLRVVDDQFGAPTSAHSIAQCVVSLLDSDIVTIRQSFERSGGLVHLASREDTSWYGFANAIVKGLSDRGVDLAAKQVIPINSNDFPTKAKRPKNSRLDLSRLADVFGVITPRWQDSLDRELDEWVRHERRPEDV
jgi:dTDP-4-dehydrorhamnose reductase